MTDSPAADTRPARVTESFGRRVIVETPDGERRPAELFGKRLTCVCGDDVEIREQNARLQQRLVQRDREVEELTAENAMLASRNNQNWFVVGAAVLLGGIVIGLIAPSLRRKRRSDW